MTSEAYQQTLKEIDSLAGRGIQKGLERMEAALRLLGNPHTRFPSLHIAGTNGKGSVCSMTAEILKRSGYKTGLTISPHIEDFRERIQVNRQWIPEEAVVSIHRHLQKRVGHIPLTWFEWTILTAFQYFAEARVDIAVLETGMGGRWDATNVAEPLASAITNVSLDHEAWLGDTVEAILQEKMRIFKPGIPGWTAIEDGKLFSLLKQYCAANHVPLYRLSDYFHQNSDESFSVFNYPYLHCGLAGAHQQKNAALSVALCETLKSKGYGIFREAVEEGIRDVSWPGRLELISGRPSILLDCAHNRGGIEILKNHLAKSGRKYHLVFGALNDRPAPEMLQSLLPFASSVRWALFDGGGREFSRAEIERITGQMSADLFPGGKKPEVLEITGESWQSFTSKIPPDETILVCGSMYLVSQARHLVKREK
ncbi:MAG: bifunctional folylpolyglutamate synthase/dihydrofolate synthase [Deltaproteobacteria bacterium]|nr:bifunctional folylpolyglutamate synthase/dihydrofolate synthase [Deltaproteobacteria bacterium]